MTTRRVALPAALSLLLLATSAMAQEISVPEQRRDMSYEEYSSVRENMRLRMEKLREAEEQNQDARSDNTSEQRRSDSVYGQGYHSRTRAESASMERPERPERPMRPERIERPERFNR